MTLNKKLIVGIAIVLLSCSYGIGQTLTDAASSYNQGRNLMSTDVSAAIDSVLACIKSCNIVGDSAANALKEKANIFLADLYCQKSVKLYTKDKNIAEAIVFGKKSVELSEINKDDKGKDKAQKLLITFYVGMGANYFKANDNVNALKAFDSALSINPNYIKALLNKALVYKKMDNATKFGETVEAFIEKAKIENDTVQIVQVKKLAFEYYRGAASKSDQANKLPDALALLAQAEKYGTDKDINYYYADVYNKQKKFEDALTYAQKGLELETGTPEAKAKFYYVIAVAQAGKGDKDNACASFKSAMFGQFVEASKAQMANLKCGQ